MKRAQQIAAARQFSIVLLGDDVRPVKQKQRRLSAAEIEAATQWVKDEVAAGRMEPSSSEWAAQLVIVPKRDEEGKVSGWRICGDYRNLNAVTKADAEPLELVQTVFDQLAGMQYFSKLDLRKGFNQIPVAAKSRELMAVSTPVGLYQPTVMPFGVKNAPGSFQREMRRVLQQRLNKGVFVFIDDIIVYSRTEAEHLELIAYVLSQLEKEGYYAHPGKCQFMRSEVSFLGHMVRRDGMSMQQHKVQAVKDWPTLQSVKDVQSFLGLANYYRRFVRGYAQIAQPLTRPDEEGGRQAAAMELGCDRAEGVRHAEASVDVSASAGSSRPAATVDGADGRVRRGHRRSAEPAAGRRHGAAGSVLELQAEQR